MNNNQYLRYLLLGGLILLAALTRLIEHPANFSPIMAIAIFGGAYFGDKRAAFAAPLLAMALSDIFLGFHLISLFVYASFVLGIFIGFMIKNRVKVKNVFFAALGGSVLFFIVTNFGSWLIDPMYKPLTFESLIRCYTLALPFFRNALAGTLVYSAVMFGAYSLAEKYVFALNRND